MNNKLKLWFRALLACSVLALGTVAANAQSNTYPDPSNIYTGLATPFNAAMTWVIGAIAVTVVIGWILKAVRRK